MSDTADAALGLANRALRINPRLRTANRKVAILGDSRTAQCTGANGPRTMGHLFWLRYLTRQRIDFKFDTSLGAYTGTPPDPQTDNYGISGETTAQILARTDAALAATDAGAFIVLAGTNDQYTSVDINTTIANLAAIRDKILAAGRICIFIAETPAGDTSFTSKRFSGANLGAHIRTRQWLLEQRNVSGVYVADPWPYWAVSNSTTGDVQVGYTYDGLHPNNVGAYYIALALQPIIEAIYPPQQLLPVSNADQYDATNNPYGCLQSNPMMDGTSGSLGTNCSGSLASSYQCGGGSGTTGSTATYSKVTGSDGVVRQQIVLAGTPTGSASVCNYDLVRTQSVSSKVNAGDILEAVCEVQVDAGATNIIQLALRIDQLSAGVTTNFIADGDFKTAGWYLPAVALNGILRTPRFLVPAYGATPSLTAKVVSWHDPNVALSATIRVGPLGFRKVA